MVAQMRRMCIMCESGRVRLLWYSRVWGLRNQLTEIKGYMRVAFIRGVDAAVRLASGSPQCRKPRGIWDN
eukprot:230314-Prymnesium_polylepis.1